MHACMLSCFGLVCIFATLSTVAGQAPLPTVFSKQEHWSGLPFLSPWALPNPGIKLKPLTSLALEGVFLPSSATGEARETWKCSIHFLDRDSLPW